MLKVDARGDACPLPVVKAKKAISELKGAGEVEVLVDNEIAVQNLTKMAQQKGYQYSAEKLAEQEYRVLFTVGNAAAAPTEEVPVCAPDLRTDTVVAVSSDKMGAGSEAVSYTHLVGVSVRRKNVPETGDPAGSAACLRHVCGQPDPAADHHQCLRHCGW